MELFDGSWSPWAAQSGVSMGGQLSRGSMTAVGMIPPGANRTGAGEEKCIARCIVPLTRGELNGLISNEWDFTTSKIHDNFSNGSAFHYRSKLLPLVLETRLRPSDGDAEGGGDAESISGPGNGYAEMLSLAREEWEEILLNAVFTEPDDQTPWWYHRFLLSWAGPPDDADGGLVQEHGDLLREMADSLRELLEVEREGGPVGPEERRDESKGAKCKWALVGLHLVLSTLLGSRAADEDEASALREEAGECLGELIEIDPDRRERYRSLAGALGGTRAAELG